MGFIFGIIKRIIRLFIYFIVFASIIVLIPNLPPYTSFTKIDLEPTLPRVGPLAPNNELNNYDKLYKDKLLGPECFQLYQGEVYTSLSTGEIVKLSPGGHVTFVTQLGKPCAGIKEERKCGRPLGFVINEKGIMYVADAYHGIWSVDLATNKKTQLVSPNVEIEGKRAKLFNSVALDSKGNVYYTDSSSEYELQDGVFSLFTDPSGRLLQYNAAKKESKVLLDKLWFANGLAVSPNDEFIVVSETGALRLIKYYLNGPKKGQKEVLLAGLPGIPDNLRALSGGLQVALYQVHGEDEPLLIRTLAAVPLARKFIVRLLHLVENAFHFLHQQYPHVVFEDAIYSIGHFKSISCLAPKSSGILHVDWNGNILNSYFHTKGEIFVSDAILFNDKIYLGQPHLQNFVTVVSAPSSFKNAYASQIKKEVPNSQAPPKPSQQAKPADTVKTKSPTPEKVAQKPEVPKTTTPPPPKPTQQPTKPAPETPKPTQRPTTTTQQPPKATPKPAQQQPKSTQQPTTTPPLKPAQQPPRTTQPPPVQATTPKPVEKKTAAPPPPKPAQETKQKPQAKGESASPKPAQQKKSEKSKEKVPEQIPITEEIPSDTIKPSKETLKVIKKAGPVEIPNPEL